MPELITQIKPLASESLATLGLSKITTAPHGSAYSVGADGITLLSVYDRMKHEGSASIRIGFYDAENAVANNLISGVQKSLTLDNGVLDLDWYFGIEYYSNYTRWHYISFEVVAGADDWYKTTLLYSYIDSIAYIRKTDNTGWNTLKSTFKLETFTHWHYGRGRISGTTITDINIGGERLAVPENSATLYQGSIGTPGAAKFIYAVTSNNSLPADTYARAYLANLRQWKDRGTGNDMFNVT